MHCARIALDVVQRSQCIQDLHDLVSSINGQEEYCLSSARILTSRNQSIVDNRMKIESTSHVVDMLEKSTLNSFFSKEKRINIDSPLTKDAAEKKRSWL